MLQLWDVLTVYTVKLNHPRSRAFIFHMNVKGLQVYVKFKLNKHTHLLNNVKSSTDLGWNFVLLKLTGVTIKTFVTQPCGVFL